ncbi:hypothetical protein Kpol_297p2 [Vanderwaltozyma polyspora DSM 70294]|uniref:t-SNARE coiled-coil homology domain-containing protein n=1 Tax=Vanderwaltozyma polyspora (strain ATCC 22028 / DSM 70294 / BCRC 21397 / CBS 2163 / NBRC 10782 / NRRL Y-8283 / UCD 57-17) TaxID=436907 RepID=A7TSK6_VANPO|nr:uncharacterized protein Kpol_297p2 [Vanderwaltozyma polyspora DSM 70294]EDO14741.1 hypothetical protein Kpol_297p2 [Vanderwaltozyma polyspora DSM 70294]
MNIKDRTTEFQQSVLSYKKQYKIANQQIETTNNESNRKDASEFQKRASGIAHEISGTAQLLSKLAILAKRKPMFNDNPVEIAELSFLIKRKIYAIEQNLVDLSKHQRSNGSQNANNNVDGRNGNVQHSKNVMNLLNTKMKNISGDFKDVLEARQRLEIANKDRWEKISSEANSDSHMGNNSGNNVNSQANNVAMYNSSNPFLSTLMDEDSAKDSKDSGKLMTLPHDSQSLLLQMEEGTMDNNVYLQERDRAMETIESTIQEVGGLFQQLASMVQEQGEVIQRIDDNVNEIDINITGAQRELLKYFDRIKSNRWLSVKIFFIIFVFFLIWVLVN